MLDINPVYSTLNFKQVDLDSTLSFTADNKIIILLKYSSTLWNSLLLLLC